MTRQVSLFDLPEPQLKHLPKVQPRKEAPELEPGRNPVVLHARQLRFGEECTCDEGSQSTAEPAPSAVSTTAEKDLGKGDRYHPPVSELKKDIIKALHTAQAHCGEGMSRLFPRWLTFCHAFMDHAPRVYGAVIRGDTEQAEALDAEFKRAAGQPSPQVMDAFREGLRSLLMSVLTEEGDFRYSDVIGSIYMGVGACEETGQFFTPYNVARCMAEMVLGAGQAEALVRQRWDEMAANNPAFDVCAHMVGLYSMMRPVDDQYMPPLISRMHDKMREMFKPILLLDPCCGSGVMHVAAASCIPRPLIDAGFFAFHGVDLDPVCVDMARLNCKLFGLNGWGMKAAAELRIAEAEALPWPYCTLYANALRNTAPGTDYWLEGARVAGAGNLQDWVGFSDLLTTMPQGAESTLDSRQ